MNMYRGQIINGFLLKYEHGESPWQVHSINGHILSTAIQYSQHYTRGLNISLISSFNCKLPDKLNALNSFEKVTT